VCASVCLCVVCVYWVARPLPCYCKVAISFVGVVSAFLTFTFMLVYFTLFVCHKQAEKIANYSLPIVRMAKECVNASAENTLQQVTLGCLFCAVYYLLLVYLSLCVCVSSTERNNSDNISDDVSDNRGSHL
jgi:hypothetical protein